MPECDEDSAFDIALNAFQTRCETAIDALAKLKAETDMADDEARGAFLNAMENAMDDLVVERLKISAGIARDIILSPDERLHDSRHESVEEFAAFSRVVAYYTGAPIKL